MNLRIAAARAHPRSVSFGSVAIYPASDIKIGNPECVFLDEFTALVHGLAHEGRERVIGIFLLLDRHLEKRSL